MTNPNDLQQDHFYKNEAISCLPGVQSWQNQLISLLSFNSRMRLQFFVIPLDLSEGSVQTYVENCPVCCRANTIHVQIDDDGDRSAPGCTFGLHGTAHRRAAPALTAPTRAGARRSRAPGLPVEGSRRAFLQAWAVSQRIAKPWKC